MFGRFETLRFNKFCQIDCADQLVNKYAIKNVLYSLHAINKPLHLKQILHQPSDQICPFYYGRDCHFIKIQTIPIVAKSCRMKFNTFQKCKQDDTSKPEHNYYFPDLGHTTGHDCSDFYLKLLITTLHSRRDGLGTPPLKVGAHPRSNSMERPFFICYHGSHHEIDLI